MLYPVYQLPGIQIALFEERKRNQKVRAKAYEVLYLVVRLLADLTILKTILTWKGSKRRSGDVLQCRRYAPRH